MPPVFSRHGGTGPTRTWLTKFLGNLKFFAKKFLPRLATSAHQPWLAVERLTSSRMMPFILHSVTLCGINSAFVPNTQRHEAGALTSLSETIA